MATSSYKNPKTPRVITDQPSFAGGINYTDNTVPNGQARLIVNYEVSEQDGVLKTRKGNNTEKVTYQQSSSDTYSARRLNRGPGYLLISAPLTSTLYFKDEVNEQNILISTDLLINTITAGSAPANLITAGGRDPLDPLINPNIGVAGVSYYRPAFSTNIGGVLFDIVGVKNSVFDTFNTDYAFTLKNHAGLLKQEGKLPIGEIPSENVEWEGPLDTIGLLRADIIGRQYGYGRFEYSAMDNNINTYQTYPACAVLNNTLYGIATANNVILGFPNDGMYVVTPLSPLTPATRVGWGRYDQGVINTGMHCPFELCKIEPYYQVSSINGTYGTSKPLLKRTALTPYVPSISESLATGFNMLLTNPYTVPNNTAGVIEVKAILPYKPGSPYGVFRLSGNIGEVVRFGLNYGYELGQSHFVKWEWRHVDSDTWNIIKDYTPVSVGTTTAIYQDFAIPAERFIIKATLRKGTDESTARVGTLIYNTGIEALEDVGTTTFDLTTALGMLTYKNSICLYGVQNAETALFMSATDDPSYFPFPHNVEYYDGIILNVLNYQDGLIVITQDKIFYTDAMGTKTIMENLNNTKADAKLALVVKNQIFMKLGSKMYIFKPNMYTSAPSDLKDYEISKPIEGLINNYNEFYKIFTTCYHIEDLVSEEQMGILTTELKRYMDHIVAAGHTPYSELYYLYDIWKEYRFPKVYESVFSSGFTPDAITSYADEGKLYITYAGFHTCVPSDLESTPPEGYFRDSWLRMDYIKVDFQLIYDLTTRTWFLEIHDSLAARRDKPVEAERIRISGNWGLEPFEDNYNKILFVKENNNSVDYYTVENIGTNLRIKNHKLLDTGVVELNNNLYKRIRELQLHINNDSEETLDFYTSVFVDSRDLVSSETYSIVHDTDPNSPTFGHLYIERGYVANVAGTTKLDSWTLDVDKFPDITLLVAHLLLIGKGRFLRAVILNKDQQPYSLNKLAWVYRTQNAR